MNRQVAAGVLVALLCVTAGCLAVGPPTSEENDAPDIDNDYTITDETVTDTSTLIGAHTQTLRQHAFTVNVTVTAIGADYRAVGNRTVRFDPSPPVRGFLYENVSVSGDPPDQLRQGVERMLYREGETTYEHILRGDGPTFRRIGLLNTTLKGNVATQRRTLASLETLDNATVETVTRDGEQLYKLTQSLPDTQIATNRSVELLVSENGVIREMEWRTVQSGPNGEMRIVRRIEITNVGETTVERPDWYDEAVGETE